MNSKSEQKYSLDELKKLNSRDLTAAGEGERHITLTDRNWTAVLRLLGRMCSTQDAILATLDVLLTRQDAEALLRQIEQTTQTQLDDLNAEADAFAQQAGNLSEKYSSLLKESEESERRNRKKWLRAILISQVCWMVLSVILVMLSR